MKKTFLNIYHLIKKIYFRIDDIFTILLFGKTFYMDSKIGHGGFKSEKK